MPYIRILLLLLLPISIYSQVFSFLGIGLEMTQEEILKSIENSTDLVAAEDILLKQLIPPTPYTLVLKSKNDNNRMVKRVFIDFLNYKSYQIAVFLTPEYFSFYTLSEKLLDKYGPPDSRSSIKVTWFTNIEKTQRITLEYPATIKFTDIPTLQNVVTRQSQILETGTSESIDYKERQRILNEL